MAGYHHRRAGVSKKGMVIMNTNEFEGIQLILDIIKHKTVYEKKINTLTELINTVGEVHEINEIKRLIQVEKAEIAAELESMELVKEKADVIINEAYKKAATIESDALSRIRTQKEVLDRREYELQENRKCFGERERELSLAEVKVRSELKRYELLH